MLWNSTNLAKFAIYSEFVWLSVYALTAILGASLNDVALLSAPLIILVLTAVEAVVIWVLIVHSAKLKL